MYFDTKFKSRCAIIFPHTPIVVLGDGLYAWNPLGLERHWLSSVGMLNRKSVSGGLLLTGIDSIGNGGSLGHGLLLGLRFQYEEQAGVWVDQ